MSVTSTLARPSWWSAAANPSSLEKRKKSGPRGRSAGGIGSRLRHRVEEHPGQPVLGGMSPGRESEPAAGTEHARELSHGALGKREVHDHQVADDSVEGCSVLAAVVTNAPATRQPTAAPEQLKPGHGRIGNVSPGGLQERASDAQTVAVLRSARPSRSCAGFGCLPVIGAASVT